MSDWFDKLTKWPLGDGWELGNGMIFGTAVFGVIGGLLGWFT